MDIGAYAQIKEHEWILKANNIEVPRLRGLRLMRDETPLNVESFSCGVEREERGKAIHQAETFNKYVGRDDVLYIHARIGGNNWAFYDGDKVVAANPWFIEKVDDAYDSTYCDIYAHIDIILPQQESKEENEDKDEAEG